MSRALIVRVNSQNIAFYANEEACSSTECVNPRKPVIKPTPVLEDNDWSAMNQDFAMEGQQAEYGVPVRSKPIVVTNTETSFPLDQDAWSAMNQDFARDDDSFATAPASKPVAARLIQEDQVDDYCGWEIDFQ